MTSQGGRPPSTGSVTSVAMASEHRDSTASSLFSFTAVSGKQRPNNGRSTQMDNLYPQLISSKLSLHEIHTGKVIALPTINQLQTQSTGHPYRKDKTCFLPITSQFPTCVQETHMSVEIIPGKYGWIQACGKKVVVLKRHYYDQLAWFLSRRGQWHPFSSVTFLHSASLCRFLSRKWTVRYIRYVKHDPIHTRFATGFTDKMSQASPGLSRDRETHNLEVHFFRQGILPKNMFLHRISHQHSKNLEFRVCNPEPTGFH